MVWFFSQLDRIETMLNQVLVQQAILLKRQGDYAMGLKEDVDALVEEVEENTTIVGSVQTLLTQLSDMLKAIPPGTDPATAAALQAAIQTLDANNKAIADAVIANTPAQPPV